MPEPTGVNNRASRLARNSQFSPLQRLAGTTLSMVPARPSRLCGLCGFEAWKGGNGLCCTSAPWYKSQGLRGAGKYPLFYGEFDGRRRKRILIKVIGE